MKRGPGYYRLTFEKPASVTGSQITQHTDEPRAIQPANLVTIGRNANPDFMPEEYASYGHEEFYRRIRDKDWIFGTWVWNMFDFSNLGRKEGDYMTQGLSLNNKGLVTFDRKSQEGRILLLQGAMEQRADGLHHRSPLH
jgi:beta-galactosidase